MNTYERIVSVLIVAALLCLAGCHGNYGSVRAQNVFDEMLE